MSNDLNAFLLSMGRFLAVGGSALLVFWAMLSWRDVQQWTPYVQQSQSSGDEEKSRLRQFFNLGDELYDRVEAPAQTVKALIQMLIGGVALVAAIVSFYVQNKDPEVKLSDFADRALTIVGVALAVSAVIELAYTFFTQELDEAIDPLILGISSFILIKISKDDPEFTVPSLLPVLLLTSAILLLFLARRLLPANK